MRGSVEETVSVAAFGASPIRWANADKRATTGQLLRQILAAP